MKNIVSIDELRNNLAELIGRVMYGGDRVMIKKYNREAAVLISVKEYEKLVDPTKRFSKSEWEGKFRLIDRIKERLQKLNQKALEAEIYKTVQEVRALKRKGV